MEPVQGSNNAPSRPQKREQRATRWQPPEFEEIRMDAEIGSYQDDDGAEWFEV
jgi:hypothetical protein